MLDRFREDVRTAHETDPAAKSETEALLYAGLHAVWTYRLAHWLWERGYRLTARALSQLVRFLTGVEIHPAADIGRRVFIDHGMGVVIGETATVGDDVTMYHGVTLGGNDPRPVKRHPTVGDDVTLGAQSTLVGDITVGDGATVGAGAVVVDDVPPGATVAGNPAARIDDAETVSADESTATSTTDESPDGTSEADPADAATADGPVEDAAAVGEVDARTAANRESVDACEADGDRPSLCCR